MGSACLAKNERIKSKDVDLTTLITKPNLREINSSNNLSIFNYQNTTSNNLLFVNNYLDIKKPEDKKQNNENEINFSGPIIRLLKREVDNYKKNVKN